MAQYAWLAATNTQLGVIITTSGFLAGFSSQHEPNEQGIESTNGETESTPLNGGKENTLTIQYTIWVLINVTCITVNMITLILAASLIIAANGSDVVPDGNGVGWMFNAVWVTVEILFCAGILLFIVDYYARIYQKVKATGRARFIFLGLTIFCCAVAIFGFILIFVLPNNFKPQVTAY